MKQGFFDREAVIVAIGRAEARAMGKALAFIRRRARTSVLRRRKAISSPGSPPSVRSKDPVATLRNILFAYQQRDHAGVVGPVKLNQKNLSAIEIGSTTVPQIHEFGDIAAIQEEQWKSNFTGQWYRRDQRRRTNPGKRYRTRRAVYKPRPFMSVALKKEVDAGTIPGAWARVIN